MFQTTNQQWLQGSCKAQHLFDERGSQSSVSSVSLLVGGFHTWGYPQIIHFLYKPSILGSPPHLWKSMSGTCSHQLMRGGVISAVLPQDVIKALGSQRQCEQFLLGFGRWAVSHDFFDGDSWSIIYGGCIGETHVELCIHANLYNTKQCEILYDKYAV